MDRYGRLLAEATIHNIKVSFKEQQKYDGILSDFNDMRDFYKDAAKDLVKNLLFTNQVYRKLGGLNENALVEGAKANTCGRDTWGIVQNSKNTIIGAALALITEGAVELKINDISGKPFKHDRVYRLGETAMKDMQHMHDYLRGQAALGFAAD